MSAPGERGLRFWEWSFSEELAVKSKSLSAKLERIIWGGMLAALVLLGVTGYAWKDMSTPATPPTNIPPMPANFQATPDKDNIPNDAPAVRQVDPTDPALKSFIPGELLPGHRYPQLGYDKATEYHMEVQATAYWTHDPEDASGHGIAYDGTPAVAYKTIAVDPKVIPLQAEVFVPGIGWCRANDTGNAIKGNIIDIAMPNRKAAWAWGRRKVVVSVRTPRRTQTPQAIEMTQR